MAPHLLYFLVIVVVTLATCLKPNHAVLTPDYYDKVCPQALPIIKSVVEQAIIRERRMGASLLRLHFHDCFVNVSKRSMIYVLASVIMSHTVELRIIVVEFPRLINFIIHICQIIFKFIFISKYRCVSRQKIDLDILKWEFL